MSKEKTPSHLKEDWKGCKFMDDLAAFADWFQFDMGPKGQPRIPFHDIVDVNKATLWIWLFGLMVYHNNFSIGAWIYLSLHGSYGIFWATKSRAFPDPGFTKPATITSCILAPFPVAIIPYYFIGYWMMTGGEEVRSPSYERIFVALQIHVYGMVLMVVTDVQKYLVLKERKGLITHGMHGWSRNLNYIGEMMVYASFGVMC